MHPDVEMADWLSDAIRRNDHRAAALVRNLEVTDEGFSVTLNFGDNPEPLYIPYDAIKTFVDPSVEFGLRFETQGDPDDDEGAPMTEMAEPEPRPPPRPQRS